MRWAFEGVTFEPSGVDHTSPGSSYVVGGQIIREVFGAEPPIGPMYAFVGISGMAKMSSSRGRRADRRPTRCPSWRRRCCAGCTPGAGPTSRSRSPSTRRSSGCTTSGTRWSPASAAGTASHGDAAAYTRSTRTAAAGELPTTPRPVPYRTLASIVDVTTGDDEQTLRILRDLDPADPVDRRSTRCGPGWTRRPPGCARSSTPSSARTCAPSPTSPRSPTSTTPQRESLRLLVDGLDAHWSLDGLTTLVYGVPKRMLGLPLDVRADARAQGRPAGVLRAALHSC